MPKQPGIGSYALAALVFGALASVLTSRPRDRTSRHGLVELGNRDVLKQPGPSDAEAVADYFQFEELRCPYCGERFHANRGNTFLVVFTAEPEFTFVRYVCWSNQCHQHPDPSDCQGLLCQGLKRINSILDEDLTRYLEAGHEILNEGPRADAATRLLAQKAWNLLGRTHGKTSAAQALVWTTAQQQPAA